MAMKLYFTPEQASRATHIILMELGFDYELIRVNPITMETSSGENFLKVNPNGYVPTLILENGVVLTEVSAMLQYLCDLKPELKLVPKADEWMRVELWEAFEFMAQEIHALCMLLFMQDIADEVRDFLVEKIKSRLNYVELKITGRTYTLGDNFTAVDAYLFSIFDWMPRFTIDLLQWPNIHNLMERLRARESIAKVQEIERDFTIV